MTQVHEQPRGLDVDLSDDRRETLRVRLPRDLNVFAANRPVPAKVVDCSLGGIGIVAESPLPKDETFVIRTNSAISLLAYRTLYCLPRPDGHFRVGARLVTCSLANATVDNIVAALLSV